MIERIAGELAGAFAEIPQGDPEQQVRFVVTAVLDATERNRELARVLVEQMPRLGGSEEIGNIERRAVDTAAGYRAALSGAMPYGRRPAMEWMAIQALQQVTARYVLDRPPIGREAFIDELTRLLLTFAAQSLSGPAGTH